MINNLGGLSVLELNVIAGEVVDQLESKGFYIRRLCTHLFFHDMCTIIANHESVVGTFVSSLDGPGFSITLLKLHTGFEELLNSITTAPAWPNSSSANNTNPHGAAERTRVEKKSVPPAKARCQLPISALQVEKVIHFIVANVVRDEPEITKFDTIAGDGDCGETLLKGVNGKNPLFHNPKLPIKFQ
jgi:dihydroxyacetone kinase